MSNPNELSDLKSLKFTSELSLKATSSKKIKAIYSAIQPETKVLITPRSNVEISLKNQKTIELKFFASDFVSLRAILASYLYWLDAIISSLDSLTKK